MCGIAGVAGEGMVDLAVLARMAAALRHRGPDGWGFCTGRFGSLVHSRLSIVDLETGAQPLANEDGTIWITCNGEIYNHHELRRILEARGHHFQTASDTEVLVHGYEEWGEGVLERLNGQFAFALADSRDDSLFLARDRYGVRPLFYAERAGRLIFASEAKAIFASGLVAAEADLRGLDEVFTFWAARAPRTVFHGLSQLEPGTWARWSAGRLRIGRWFTLEFPPTASVSSADHVPALRALLGDAVDLRLRADVPVGAYLSGGVDSSILCALAARVAPDHLHTFSVAFDDPRFDERDHQRVVAEAIGSCHHVHPLHAGEIARIFPAVVRHTETPLVRTAPAPLFQLSRLARECGVNVVLTGEGADESFFGYDLFKEVVVRLFCLRRPESPGRRRLFDRLYPHQRRAGEGGDLWARFFLEAGEAHDPLLSHRPRFFLTQQIKHFLSHDVRAALGEFSATQELESSLPPDFGRWTPLGRAAWLEFNTLLAGYLLSSQGDRVAMAHGVEGRFPYLDHRVVAFAAGLPESSRLLGLHDKIVLRELARAELPAQVAARAKQPYRAPDVEAFVGPVAQEALAPLEPEAVRRTGLFEPTAVAALARRAKEGRISGVRESQALVAVLSTQLWHQTFIASSLETATLDIQSADVAASVECAAVLA